MGNRYRHVVTGVLLPLLIGIFFLFDLAQRPRFAAYHRVDVVQLVGLGMLFGISFTGLIEFIRRPHTG